MTPPCTCRARAAANSAPRAVIRCPRCVVQDTYFEQLREGLKVAERHIWPLFKTNCPFEQSPLLSDIDAALAGIEAGKP